jgi:hypothetical protein
MHAVADGSGIRYVENAAKIFPLWYFQGAAARYVLDGVLPASPFLEAVLCNDLRRTIDTATAEELSSLAAVVIWFKAHAPVACWGDMARCMRWSAAGGMRGRHAARP